MNNPITTRLAELLQGEMSPGLTVAQALAAVILKEALAGNMSAASIVMDALETHDPALDPAWSEDEEDEPRVAVSVAARPCSTLRPCSQPRAWCESGRGSARSARIPSSSG